ncbi:Rhombotin-1 [Halotydeus destructor]|nr:Rhombotin-1 [Halotydeus destructor]
MNGKKANRASANVTGGATTAGPAKGRTLAKSNGHNGTVEMFKNEPTGMPMMEPVMGSLNNGTLGPYHNFRSTGSGHSGQPSGQQQQCPSSNTTTMPVCAGCSKNISERYLLKALDQLWHEDCLKCSCCECRLGEVGSSLYTKGNLILCKRDYLRMFGSTGVCSACHKTIPAFEMVMRARGNNYHLECFACQKCNHRFCVGDKFYLHENQILCEYDHEEVVNNGGHNLGNLTTNSIPVPQNKNSTQNWCSSLEKLKRQTESIDTNATGQTQLMSH